MCEHEYDKTLISESALVAMDTVAAQRLPLQLRMERIRLIVALKQKKAAPGIQAPPLSNLVDRLRSSPHLNGVV